MVDLNVNWAHAIVDSVNIVWLVGCYDSSRVYNSIYTARTTNEIAGNVWTVVNRFISPLNYFIDMQHLYVVMYHY